MAQLLVRNIEETVNRRLRERAARHGKSMEEEARDVLRAAVALEPGQPERLGSAIAARFAGVGLTESMWPEWEAELSRRIGR